MNEELLLLTLNEYEPGQILNVDGQRYRIARVISWTGTVARFEIECLNAERERGSA